MRKLSAVLALTIAAVTAAPAQAQLTERVGGILTGRTGDRAATRTDGRVITGSDRRVDPRTGEVYGRSSTSSASRIPPGHLPPPGQCRVWVDGVPPGRQSKPTDCRTAEAERYRIGGNARVIYGDRTPHPGRDRSARDDQRSRWPTEIDGRRGDRDDDDRWERDDDRRERDAKARAKAGKNREKAARKQAKGNGKSKDKG